MSWIEDPRTSDQRVARKVIRNVVVPPATFVNTVTRASRPRCSFHTLCTSTTVGEREFPGRPGEHRLSPRSSLTPPLKGELILVVILAGYWTGAGKGVTWARGRKLSDRCSWIQQRFASATEGTIRLWWSETLATWMMHGLTVVPLWDIMLMWSCVEGRRGWCQCCMVSEDFCAKVSSKQRVQNFAVELQTVILDFRSLYVGIYYFNIIRV